MAEGAKYNGRFMKNVMTVVIGVLLTGYLGKEAWQVRAIYSIKNDVTLMRQIQKNSIAQDVVFQEQCKVNELDHFAIWEELDKINLDLRTNYVQK